jgi:transcriptional regulator with XRE-family HTH domain
LQYSYDLLQKQLGARIKVMRKERGWTLRDMVIKHDVHLTHWQHFERGSRGISVPSLLRIAEIFGVTPSQLLEDLGTEGAKPKARKAPGLRA